MRRAAIVLVAVMMCAGYSFEQSLPKPQWKVIKEGHLTGGTEAIASTVLFTPAKNGFYRLAAYLSDSGPLQNACYYLIVKWTDQTEHDANASLSGCPDGNHPPFQDWSQSFSPKSGTPVSFAIELSDPAPHDTTYNFAFTIEKLTH